MPFTPEHIAFVTPERLSALPGQVASLDNDPLKPGVGMHQLRAFYPKEGWGKIMALLDAGVQAGTLKTFTTQYPGQGTPIQYWQKV